MQSSRIEGRPFQPAPGSGGIRLRMNGGAFDRPAFVGQQIPEQPQMAQAPVVKKPLPSPQPPPQEPVEPEVKEEAVPAEEKEVQRHPAVRLAWGRLKKKDAGELAQILADVMARMRAKNIPPGMIAQIQARLANFAATGSDAAEVEITEHEVERMNAEILSLEEAEKASESPNGSGWLIAVGAAIGIGLLIDAVS